MKSERGGRFLFAHDSRVYARILKNLRRGERDFGGAVDHAFIVHRFDQKRSSATRGFVVNCVTLYLKQPGQNLSLAH